MITAHASSGKLPELEQGNTRDKVAAQLGISGRTYEKARAVVEAAAAEPERFGPLVEEMDSTGKVSGAHRKLLDDAETEAPSVTVAKQADDKTVAKPKRAVAPPDIALIAFDERTLDLIRRISKHPPGRFAKTAVKSGDLSKLGKFYTDLASLKKSGASVEQSAEDMKAKHASLDARPSS
jgi:hypothetical protein